MMILQDKFLSTLKVENSSVTLFLVNGVKLQGIITCFDNFSICLERQEHKQLVYKHAIAAIVPVNTIKLFDANKQENTEKNNT